MALQAPGLDSGLSIIEAVSESGEIGFNQLKSKLGLSPASLNRYLKILMERDFIDKSETQQYVPGAKLKALCRTDDVENFYTDVTEPVLEKISTTLGYTSLLIRFYGGKMICTGKHVVPEGLVMQDIGSTRTDYLIHPWGYLFLASMEEKKQHFYMQNATIPPHFTNYVPDKLVLKRFIEKASKNGISDDEGSLFPNLRRIAVPIYVGKKLEAAIGIGMPGASYPDAHIEEIMDLLKEKSNQISNLILDHRSRL